MRCRVLLSLKEDAFKKSLYLGHGKKNKKAYKSEKKGDYKWESN